MEVSATHDRKRAWKIRHGLQDAVDVPIPTLRAVLRTSAHTRRALIAALGERTIAAVENGPNGPDGGTRVADHAADADAA